jgi:Rod binding domain-containing protein
MGPIRPAAEPAAAREELDKKRRQEAVRGFEEMFVSQLLKSMRGSAAVEDESGTKKIWRERFDAEIARRIAEAGGIGLSSLVEKGMGGKGVTAGRK